MLKDMRSQGNDPIEAWLNAEAPFGLAVILRTEGPSYRAVGAMMAVLQNGEMVGDLSSGCIDQDVARHLRNMVGASSPKSLRYGAGSAFKDLLLPCGGALEILLLPQPERAVLEALQNARARRQIIALGVDIQTGLMRLEECRETNIVGNDFTLCFRPPPRFVLFGKGPEAPMLATLACQLGYPTELFTVEDQTRVLASQSLLRTQVLEAPKFPKDLSIDAHTAIAIFFHDHDWEPELLAHALESDAFYVGAQGSLQAHEKRLSQLRKRGVSKDAINRLHAPIGLIPSAREPSVLAVSVLAEILQIRHLSEA